MTVDERALMIAAPPTLPPLRAPTTPTEWASTARVGTGRTTHVR
jgi:hypothetical protein